MSGRKSEGFAPEFMILEGKSLLIMPPTHPFPIWYNLGQKWCALLVNNDLQYEAIMKYTLAMIWGNILIFNCKHWSELGFLVKPWYVRTAWELELGRAPFSPLRVLSLLSSNNYTSSLTMLDIGGEWIGNFTLPGCLFTRGSWELLHNETSGFIM